MKIDVFSHVLPEKYKEALTKIVSRRTDIKEHMLKFPPPLFDMSARFAIMDSFPEVQQVLVPAEPPIELVAEAGEAADLARIANDGMAELVDRYPDRFAAAVAILPLNDIDAALDEIDRAVKDLKLKGILLYSAVSDVPLDAEKFLPIYEKMSGYDLPIWVHPFRDEDFIDYRSESRSYYGICGVFGWPHDTSVMMYRLSCSGVMARYPNLKIITHHGGGTAPYLSARIAELGCLGWMISADARYARLEKEPVEYMQAFYGDTAIFGDVSGLMCSYRFFGAEHMMFGTDSPFSVGDPTLSGTAKAISGIDSMPISDADREKIYRGNARRLLHLD